MSKNKLPTGSQDILNDNIDDMYDFDDYDLDSLDDNSRNADDGKGLKGDLLKVAKHLDKKSLSKGILNKMLPKEYESLTDSLARNYDTASTLYDKTTAPTKKALRDNYRTLKQLSPYVDDIFGKEKGQAYRDKIGKYERYRGSNYDTDDIELQKHLSDAFGNGKATDNEKLEVVQDVVRERKELLRFNKTFRINSEQLDYTKRILAYHEQVDYKYKRKSLELKVRTYIELRKFHAVSQAGWKDLATANKYIIKNTSLPDIQKMRFSEKSRDMLREQLIGKAQTHVSEISSKYLKNVFSNLGERLGNATDTALDFGGQILEAKADLEEGGGNLSDIYGGFLGKFLSEAAGGKIGQWVGKKTGIRNRKDIKNVINKLRYASANAEGMLADKLENADGLLGFLADGTPRESYNLSLNKNSLDNSNGPATYGHAERKSIIEIIPGLLSRILQSSEGIRTGEMQDLVAYDWKKNTFTSKSVLVKNAANDLLSNGNMQSMQQSLDKVMDGIIGDKAVSSGAKEGLRKELLSRILDGRHFSPSVLGDPGQYKNKIDKKYHGEIRGLFSDINDPKLLSKDFWTDDSNTKLFDIDNEYRSAMGSFPDFMQAIRKHAAVGQQDIYNDLGLTNARGDIDRGKLLDFINGKVGANGTSKTFPETIVPTGRYGSNVPSAGFVPVSDGNNQSSGGYTDQSTQILADIKDAMASAQALKEKIYQAEIEIRDTTQSIRDFLPEINATVYNVSGEELAEAMYNRAAKGIGDAVDNTKKSAAKHSRRFKKRLGNIVTYPFKRLGSIASGVKDYFGDIYVEGNNNPVMTSTKLKAGHYRDKATGEVIKSFKDIKGAVIDENDNVVVTDDDVKNGLLDNRGKRLLKRTSSAIGGFARWGYKKLDALNPLSMVTRTLGRIRDKAIGWIKDNAVDVYVRGEISPRLLRMIFLNGGYFSKKTNKPIYSADKIDGEVIDSQGNVLLSNEDIAKGLVDKFGKPLTFNILVNMIRRGKNLAGNLIKPLLAVGRAGINAAKSIGRGLFRGTAALGRFIFGRKFSEAAADRMLPEDASLEARYLNRIYYFLRSSFGGAANGLFNKMRFGFGGSGSGSDDAKETKRSRKARQRQEKMDEYRYKRWLKEKANDRVEDEAKRKNSWLWKLRNPKKVSPKAEKKAAEKKFGWLKFVLGGIATLGFMVVKGIGKFITGAAGLITKGIGGIIKPILSSVGSAAMTGLGAAGKGIATVATWAGRGLLSAAGAVLTNPIGLAVVAVALTAVAGYTLYKWWSGRLKPLQRYRYAQYGADLNNEDLLKQVAAAEKYFYDNLSYGREGTPPVLDKTFDSKYFAELCGVKLGGMEDYQTKSWINWFDRRFIPVAMTHATHAQLYIGTKPFYDADELMDDKYKVMFATKCHFDTTDPNCPYNLYGGPNPFVDTITGSGVILQELNDIRKEFLSDMPQEERTKIRIDVLDAPLKKVDAEVAQVNKVDKKSGETLNVNLDTKDKVSIVSESNGKTIQLTPDIIEMQETSQSANAFTWARLFCYGLTPTSASKPDVVNKILALEYKMLKDYIKFRNGKLTYTHTNKFWSIEVIYRRKEILPMFRWEGKFDDCKPFFRFLLRFLAVFGKYIAIADKYLKGVDLLDVYKQDKAILYKIANNLVNTKLGDGIVINGFWDADLDDAKSDKLSVWVVDGQIVGDDKSSILNTMPSTVDYYLDKLNPDKNKGTNADAAPSSPKINKNASPSLQNRFGFGRNLTLDEMSNYSKSKDGSKDIADKNAYINAKHFNEVSDDGDDTGNIVTGDGSLPTGSNVVTSLFGKRTLDGNTRMHSGIDLRAKAGDPIYAFKDGVVTTGWGEKYGTIVIDHGNGLRTRYLHTEASLVKEGDEVKAGDMIGKAGGRGFDPKLGRSRNNKYVPHLHFETLENGVAVNPLNYLLGAKLPLQEKMPNGSLSELKQTKTQTGMGKPMPPSLAKGGNSSVTSSGSKSVLPSTDVIGLNKGDGEYGEDDTGLSGGVRYGINKKGDEVTLLETNNILGDTYTIQKAMLKTLTNIDKGISGLVQNQADMIKVMVGGKEVNVKRAKPTQPERVAPHAPFVAFSK